jgi:hypothetical protein
MACFDVAPGGEDLDRSDLEMACNDALSMVDPGTLKQVGELLFPDLTIELRPGAPPFFHVTPKP